MTGAAPNPEFGQRLVALLPRLRRYARVLTGDSHAADDLVQDTLERGWARCGQWQQGTDLRAWLFSIMHNRRVDLLRGQRPFVDMPVDALDSEPAPSLFDAVALDPIDLQRAFERLSPAHREIMLLVAVEQMSYEEAAESIGVAVGTVMSRLARARAALRALLDAHAPAAKGNHLTRVK
ncbi:MAG TPA: RNA polymerase sigma factor [Burkholderiaceae bacterium]